MTRQQGERMVGPLSWDVYDNISWLGILADSAADHMEQAWQRRVRHNKKIELLALHDVLLLDDAGESALARTETAPFLPRDTDVSTAYRWEAALLTVGKVVPFTKAERMTFLLGRRQPEYPPDFGVRVTREYPELVDRWHGWLWLDLDAKPVRDREALGASAILAAACDDIADIAHATKESVGGDKCRYDTGSAPTAPHIALHPSPIVHPS